jgi:hypothetical protein
LEAARASASARPEFFLHFRPTFFPTAYPVGRSAFAADHRSTLASFGSLFRDSDILRDALGKQ